MNSQFEKDFTQLNLKLISRKPHSEIRKEYLKLQNILCFDKERISPLRFTPLRFGRNDRKNERHQCP